MAGGFDATGLRHDWADRMGHGTAVAGAIRDHAPDADLFAVKIFEGTLRTNIETIVRGIEWAVNEGMDWLNLSLGTHNEAHAEVFGPWVLKGPVWVCVADAWPGKLDGVVAVAADEALERNELRKVGEKQFAASPFPREIPGVPRDRNLKGISFAVANATGLLAGGKYDLT